ncbi:MAG: sodium:alanine symporter family protein [Megasphaera sp.]|jgi:AGCS family alanine or glycine:cation symporter|nr:sodium:alanine symporter family protein [Megasphaera sp.]
MDFAALMKTVNDFVWGPVMLAFLVGTGIFLTIRLKFLPWRNLRYAIEMIFRKGKHQGDISPFQSLMTALSATIGTGNIVGVATAIVLGGPGALVWMFISACFGLSTKYAESVLAVKYREVNSVGEMAGGPMYAMKNGIKNKFAGRGLAFLFALFAVCASFGIGNMTQANSIAAALFTSYAIPTEIVGGIIVIASLIIFLRGIKGIGKVSSIIVPFMAGFYFLAAIIVIIVNIDAVPAGIAEMFRMAFSFDSVAGGIGGSIVASALTAMRWGVARGVFSNEAGLGSAPIAAAAAQTDHPSRQGYVNMTGTFFDTMIICMLTGLVICSSGVLGTIDPATAKPVTGAQLTILAFSSVFGEYGKLIVCIALSLFAFSTILGWEYYGEKSLEYLVSNRKVIMGYRVVFSLITYVGATQALEMVWNFSDTMNGLMIIPNLICLLWLNKDIAKECFEYQTAVVIPEKNGEKVDYETVHAGH